MMKFDKRKKKVLLVGGLGLILILSVLSLDTTILWSQDFTTEMNSALSMSMVGMLDGEPVSVPITFSGFRIDGVEVDSLGFNFTWQSSGENIRWSTFELAINIHVEYQDNIYALEPPWPVSYDKTINENDANGTHFEILTFGSNIATQADRDYDPMNPDRVFWHFAFYLSATVSVYDEMDVEYTESVSAEPFGINIKWDSNFDFELLFGDV